MGQVDLFTPFGAIQSRRNLMTLAAMRNLATSMARLSGRKNLLWVGTGLMTAGGRGSELMAGNRAGQSDVSPDQVDNLPGRDVRDVLNREIKVTGHALNDAGAAVYAIDARALSIDNTVASDANSMNEITRLTGGAAYLNRKDVASSVRAALDDSREVYMLTFTPTPLKQDGRFHEINVRTSRANLKLRCGEGYTAPAPQSR
jgi:VWFA-related protein